MVGAQARSAFFLRSLENPGERREQRPDILDTPILPGSVMKTVTLVAALESQVIEPETARAVPEGRHRGRPTLCLLAS